jgi:hypothetical protein
LNAPFTATTECHLHRPPPPPPLVLSTASPSSLDKKRGSSSSTTSVPKAAPMWKHLQVQMTWTDLTYLQYLKCVMFVKEIKQLVSFER